MCHQGIEPKYLAYSTDEYDGRDRDLQVVLTCPRKDCRSVFIAYYGLGFGGSYELQGCLPYTPKKPDVPESVAAISERFVKVYTEAESAHSHHLDEVAGGGYRKALEVLVKDFLIVRGIKDEATVIEMSLHDAVKALPSEVATNLAYFTKVLGNDETHFYRELSGKSIEELRGYLDATVTTLKLYLIHEAGVEEFGLPK